MRTTNSLLLIAVIAITCLVSSCSKDDGSNASNQGNEQLANEQNATEDTKIPTSTLETGIEIEGANKETGTPPAPNSSIDFQLNTDLTEGFQGSGLRIQFSSTESISGAYIQFKDTDGNASSSYFDVSSSLFNNESGRSARKGKSSRKSISKKRSTQDFNDQIEVDFGSEIPAGQFCYDICVYDELNNISPIQTVCVTVEAWGGNASIVGDWVFDRYEPEEGADIEIIDCESGQTIEVEYEQSTKDEWTLTLNEDGTYFEVYEQEGIEINYGATVENCLAIYGELRINEKYSGNWAYNEEKGTLTIVNFKYEDLLDASNNTDYEDGELHYGDVSAEVISEQLVLSEIDGYGEAYKTYLNRK